MDWFCSGDSLTHMVLDSDPLKIIYCSAIRPRTLKNPNQRIVAAEGEEDHQPHSKMLKLLISSRDDGTPTKPDIPTVFLKSRHDDGPTQASLYLSSTQMISLEGPFY